VKDNNRPILSICIPTYNRGQLLNKLLRQIDTLNGATKSKIEICISDNYSSDSTEAVIDQWRIKLNLVAIRQKSNIGGSRNFQEVARLSTGKWMLLIGDDDLLCITGFENLIQLLNAFSSQIWVLANILNPSGTTLLKNFSDGACSINEFKKRILVDSLDSLGFISSHLIPRKSIEKFVSLNIESIYGWPHLAMLFIDLENVEIFVYKECIVKRGGDSGEVTQTWRPNDWLCLMMQKTKLCCYSEKGKNLFSTSLALREYLRTEYAVQTLYSILYLKKKKILFAQLNKYLNLTDIKKIAKYVIKLYVLILLLIPVKLISILRSIKNPEAVIPEENIVNDLTDGMKRGL